MLVSSKSMTMDELEKLEIIIKKARNSIDLSFPYFSHDCTKHPETEQFKESIQ